MKPHAFWQEIIDEPGASVDGPFHDRYPARLPDGRVLYLPIRPLAGDKYGLASLIINQASFAVQDELAAILAARLAVFAPDIVVGLPTLGLTLAALVARKLGHARYVPFGTSRKFWYTDALSVPVSSVTTRGQKRLYADPRMLPLLAGRRVALVDDVISSGTSMLSGLDLLARCGVVPIRLGVAMVQTERWRSLLVQRDAALPDKLAGVFTTPLLARIDERSWRPAMSDE